MANLNLKGSTFLYTLYICNPMRLSVLDIFKYFSHHSFRAHDVHLTIVPGNPNSLAILDVTCIQGLLNRRRLTISYNSLYCFAGSAATA